MQLANKLNTAVKGQERGPLDIFVQVNTSGEESKFGVEPQDCVSLAEHVHKECDLLRFAGLMTIGQQDYPSRPEDFQVELFLLLCLAVLVIMYLKIMIWSGLMLRLPVPSKASIRMLVRFTTLLDA